MERVIRVSRVFAVAVLCLLSAVPARADGVAVGFQVSIGVHDVAIRDCTVAVPAGSGGVAVLDAAVASGCISSYETQSFTGFGNYVTCVDGICQQADGLATFWQYFRDNVSQSEGIDSFGASDGAGFELVYSPSASCFLPTGCLG